MFIVFAHCSNSHYIYFCNDTQVRSISRIILTSCVQSISENDDPLTQCLCSLGASVEGSFRLDYEYEIEYEYDFRFSNQ